MPVSQTQFQNAHHLEINGGQFINNSTIIEASKSDPVSTILPQYVAAGAIFDSAERYPPGKCHPGTRQTVIQQINEWIDDSATKQYVLWLYGPAGAGKSAVAQSTCELLVQSHPEMYGASFFFANGSAERGNALKLITSLSYQLAVRFPGVRSEINKALDSDPILPTKAMGIQMLTLIINPIFQCKQFPSRKPVIIIDGLDECADDDGASTQRSIIALIVKLVVDYRVPLRFMIASRPEYWIRDEFDVAPLPQITLRLSLRHSCEADQDIRTYLFDGFERIRMEKNRVMGSVELPWPSTDIVDRLVYEASGQFIYASTILKFVGQHSRYSNPKEQLRIITSPGPHRASAFSELDRLYATILSAYPRWETMKRFLRGLLTHPNPTTIGVLLNIDPDEVVMLLDALSSLIDIRRPSALSTEERILESTYPLMAGRDTVEFCHLSFREFLQDDTRSGAYHIDASNFWDEIAQTFFNLIHRNIDQGYKMEPHLVLNIHWITYNFVMDEMAFHSFQRTGIDKLLHLITCMSEKLVLPDDFCASASFNSLICFTQDMRRLECSSETLTMPNQDPNRLQETSREKFQSTWKKFKSAIFEAQIRAMHALTRFREFEVTPILVYLAEFHDPGVEGYISPSTLTSFFGVTAIDLVGQHHQILTLSYRPSTSDWTLRQANLDALPKDWYSTDLSIQNQWKEQRNFIIRCLLTTLFSTGRMKSLARTRNSIALKKSFFDSRSIADVCTRKHNLHNSCKCPFLLESIIGLSKWAATRRLSWISSEHESNFLLSAMHWLSRQLTNLQTLKLIQDHDANLPPRLAAPIEQIFVKIFRLPGFGQSYDERLHAHVLLHMDRMMSVVVLQASPLPRGLGFHREIIGPSLYDPELENEDWDSRKPDWLTFHTQPLAETLDRILNSTSTLCVTHPSFLIRDHPNPWIPDLPPWLSELTHFLQFALPTSENLHALRLLVYFDLNAPHISSLLPGDVWPSILDFLRKYDRSELSSQELQLFEEWIHDMKSLRLKVSSQSSIQILAVFSLPRGFRQKETAPGSLYSLGHMNRDYPKADWCAFDDHLFKKMVENPEDSTHSTMIPSCWHPYLAARLLKILVEFLNDPIYSDHPNSRIPDLPTWFSALSHFLQFALPTSENLHALRLLVYLDLNAPHISSLLPGDVWPSISDFLQKYDRSVLFSQELQLFEEWIHDMKSLRLMRQKVSSQSSVQILEVFPLPQGFLQKETMPGSLYSLGHMNRDYRKPDWYAFDDHLFKKMVENPETPSYWHPYLAARLLKILVEFLNDLIYSDHPNPRIPDLPPWLSELTHFLQFTLPTSENLHALRLLVYLDLNATHISSLLPEDVWPSILDFLRKYDRSVLSSQELQLFEEWIHDMKSLRLMRQKVSSQSSVQILKVFPLPRGFRQKETAPGSLYHLGHMNRVYPKPDWCAFDDHLLKKMVENPEDSTHLTTKPSCWHPYLAARFLKILAEFFNDLIYSRDPELPIPNFLNSASLSYLAQWIQFAPPTSENLQALRLIVYLYPHITRYVSFRLPEGIRLPISTFLQKYDLSVLSPEELALFDMWFESPQYNICQSAHRTC